MDDFKKGLFKTLAILKDYLQDIVIAGGWAPLIYYHYLLSNKNLNPLRTKDIDNEAQFKHYVLGIFQEFMNNVSSLQE